MSYEERRVRVSTYGTLTRESPLLIPVPGAEGAAMRLHALAAQAFRALATAVRQDLGIELVAASAWRPHRWRSRAHYEQTLIERYGSVKEGRRWLAFDSPHETGLAVDLGAGGLWPDRKTAAAQRERPLHRWLVECASQFGWHPYMVEPWHWEHPVSLAGFRSGRRGANDFDLPDALGDVDDDVAEDTELDAAHP